MYDIIIRNGLIVNGIEKSHIADIGINSDSIVKIGNIDEVGIEEIDATGKIVTPGFIDFHSHNDRVSMHKTPMLAKITQGITSEVIGNCGYCATDSYCIDKGLSIEKDIITVLGNCPKGVNPLSWEENLDYLDKQPLLTNLIPLAGHNNIKTSIMGIEDRQANDKELKAMRRTIREIMELGYWGFSTGLIYPPGIFASTNEIVLLASEVYSYSGIYTTHIRGESKNLLNSIREAISVGKETGVSVEISHLKAVGKNNWDKTDSALQIIYQARDMGVDVNFDQYPYTACSTIATMLLPPWMQEGGRKEMLRRLADKNDRQKARYDILNGIEGWENFLADGPENIVISQVKTSMNRKFEGKDLQEISSLYGKDYIETLFDLLQEEECNILMITLLLSEESVKKILKQKIGFVGTDGIPCRRPHPRLWGSFPRILGKYVREEKVLTLQEAIYKFATGPAEKLTLYKRGEIKEGNFADIVVFDKNQVKDVANFQNPTKRAEGIEYVIVNGKITISNCKFTNVFGGKLLRRGEH
ncbi:D-aminoacylase [bacterium]|nr:D-aminoacylase [bacterium]